MLGQEMSNLSSTYDVHSIWLHKLKGSQIPEIRTQASWGSSLYPTTVSPTQCLAQLELSEAKHLHKPPAPPSFWAQAPKQEGWPKLLPLLPAKAQACPIFPSRGAGFSIPTASFPRDPTWGLRLWSRLLLCSHHCCCSASIKSWSVISLPLSVVGIEEDIMPTTSPVLSPSK